jgi:predicted CXXCH cytochrome family protein
MAGPFGSGATRNMTRNRPKSAGKSGSRTSSGAPQTQPPQDISSSSTASRLPKRAILVAASVALLIVVAIGLGFLLVHGGGWTASSPDVSIATFVGSETCAGCHHEEAQLWWTSQHKLAMQHATDKTVLGDFNDAGFDYYRVHSRFFRKDGRFFVETDGPDGRLTIFEVKYTFGIDPLQQYLIEFPDGRLQALSIAWDTRPKDQGGQRWFHLYPEEHIRHDDPLHWTKLNQNWNFMCAECHSTGVRKNYDAKTDRFATTWAEISVGCEACHGRGSRHVAWAHSQKSWWPFAKKNDPTKGLAVRFDERRDIIWRPDTRTGNAQRSFTPATLRKEIETCGLCHARRGAFSEDWSPGRPLSDTHMVSPIARGLYYADGQMLDEVYNYGSFKQSKMFAAGVTCSDCHEPHAAKLRAPGDGVCLQCHAPDKYTAAAHHRHPDIKPALTCASCHMPARTYMVVDRRHDHSFRVPRPDVSVKVGTPNACNDCHTDKPAQWAAAAIERSHGPNRKGWQNYAEAFHSAWNGQIDAAALLAAVARDHNGSAFARASALTELAPYLSPANIDLARNGLSDPDPTVRIGALDMLANLPPAQIWRLVSPLLSDSHRGVRIRAVALLAAVPTASQIPADRQRFDRAAAEFIAAQQLNADRPEARSTLGNFYARRGRPSEAEAEYKAALRLNPQSAVAAINLADLYRQLRRDSEGESVLRTALSVSPRDAGLHHALGLVLTRLKHRADAITELHRAAELEPERARYAYVYAVALDSAGLHGEAMTVLRESLVRHPGDRDILQALLSFSRNDGDFKAALEYAKQLVRLTPDDPNLAVLIENLRHQIKQAQ